ncbi:MAG: hypothetical protein ACYCU7_08775 [Acidimicrobiales bacterium]
MATERIADLVQLLEPEVAPPSAAVRSRQRDALLRSMAPPAENWRRRGWRRLPRRPGWLAAAALGAAAAVAAVAVIAVPGNPPAPRPRAAAPGTSAVLTAVRRALAGTIGDIEEVRSTVPAAVPLSSTTWVDLASGACRTDTSVGGRPSLTVFVEDGRAVVVDYRLGEWWARGSEGVTCTPPTPQSIEHDLATGHDTLVGRAIVGGRETLELRSTVTTSGPHPVARSTTLWVDAASFLPIRSTSVGRVGEQTVFRWLPATPANAGILHATVPAGFRHVGTSAAPAARPAGR